MLVRRGVRHEVHRKARRGVQRGRDTRVIIERGCLERGGRSFSGDMSIAICVAHMKAACSLTAQMRGVSDCGFDKENVTFMYTSA